MPGRLDLRALEALVRGGEIDTVLTVFPDGYGRLMGKRVVARHFLEHVARDGVHACVYLFTVDMEMEPLPGFKLTSWERGYGDMKLVPPAGRWGTIPWLAGTAFVFCGVGGGEGGRTGDPPRKTHKRQLGRAARGGYGVRPAAELEFFFFRKSSGAPRPRRYQGLTP